MKNLFRSFVLTSISTLCLTNVSFSASSVDALGLGAELPIYAARQLAMGQSGSASLDRKSFNILNPAAMAYNEHTVFGATFGMSSTLSNQNGDRGVQNSFSFKNIDMTIPLGRYGNFGVSYFQKTQSDLEYSDGTRTSQIEGGLSEFTPTYAVQVTDMFSIGTAYHFVMGRQRLFSTETINASDVDLSQAVLVDQLVYHNDIAIQNSGSYYTLSLHYHQRDWDLNLRYLSAMTLDRTFNQSPYFIQDSVPLSDSKLRPKFFVEEVKTSQETPWALGFGAAYEAILGHEFVVDYQYQVGEGALKANPFISIEDTKYSEAHSWGLGWERFGSGRGFDNFLKKVALRAGYFGKTFSTNDLVENGVSLGLGMPLGRRGSMIDLSYQTSYKGPSTDTEFEEFDHGIYISLRGLGNWGEPSRRYR